MEPGFSWTSYTHVFFAFIFQFVTFDLVWPQKDKLMLLSKSSHFQDLSDSSFSHMVKIYFGHLWTKSPVGKKLGQNGDRIKVFPLYNTPHYKAVSDITQWLPWLPLKYFSHYFYVKSLSVIRQFCYNMVYSVDPNISVIKREHSTFRLQFIY